MKKYRFPADSNERTSRNNCTTLATLDDTVLFVTVSELVDSERTAAGELQHGYSYMSENSAEWQVEQSQRLATVVVDSGQGQSQAKLRTVRLQRVTVLYVRQL